MGGRITCSVRRRHASGALRDLHEPVRIYFLSISATFLSPHARVNGINKPKRVLVGQWHRGGRVAKLHHLRIRGIELRPLWKAGPLGFPVFAKFVQYDDIKSAMRLKIVNHAGYDVIIILNGLQTW